MHLKRREVLRFECHHSRRIKNDRDIRVGNLDIIRLVELGWVPQFCYQIASVQGRSDGPVDDQRFGSLNGSPLIGGNHRDEVLLLDNVEKARNRGCRSAVVAGKRGVTR